MHRSLSYRTPAAVNFVFILISFAVTVFLCIRIRYGIDLTDEAWIYASSYIGFNDGMPFGFSVIWHELVTLLNLSVLEIRFLRLIASTGLILILSLLLTKYDLKEVSESTLNKNLFQRIKLAISNKNFIQVATFGLLGNLLSYSYLPPFLGYNESVVLFTQVNIIAIVYLVKSPGTSKRVQYLLVFLLAMSSLATFLSKFSSGVISISLIFMFMLFGLNRMLCWIYLLLLQLLFAVLYLLNGTFRSYLYQIFLVLTDSVRAEHFGHKSSEILFKSVLSLKYFLPLFLLVHVLAFCLRKYKFAKGAQLYSTFFLSIFFILAIVISRLNLDSQVGFPSNYNYLRLLMMLLVAIAIYLIGATLRSSYRSASPKNSNKYLYLLCFSLVLTQPLGSINEPWGILSASSGTILILIAYLASGSTVNKLKMPNLFPFASALVAGVVFMTVYSGLLMPYRQASVFQDKFQISIGPLKGIWTDEKTYESLQKLSQDTNSIKDLGVTDLIALDTPMFGVLEPNLITQPIWLAQWWGITPDVLVENCLSNSNLNRKFALYLPNGEPDWPQLEDALVLCGLERNKSNTSSIKILEPIVDVDQTIEYCTPSISISRSNLGQGWWPAPQGPFWSNNGYVNLKIPNIQNAKQIVLPFSKLNSDVKVELLNGNSNQKLDVGGNSVVVDINQAFKHTDVWLKISNSARPINTQSDNLDVRELGILVSDVKVTC